MEISTGIFRRIRFLWGTMFLRGQPRNHTEPPQKSKLSRNGKGKRRIGWAALLKRTFEIDVLHCPQYFGRKKLAALVMTADIIRETLVGIGVSPRRPPIIPAKPRGLFAFDEFGDFAPEQTESHEPFADW